GTLTYIQSRCQEALSNLHTDPETGSHSLVTLQPTALQHCICPLCVISVGRLTESLGKAVFLAYVLGGWDRWPALWLPLAFAVGDRQSCQLKVGTQVGFFPPKDRQTIREIEGGTAWEKRTSDIGPCGFVVCLSCSDRRGVDLESVEGTIKDDISLKGVLYGATGRLLSSATGCVFSLTCTSPCMSSPL
ncbi:hypothetical protein GOODEAATRI_001893, partial [Goodea atripinnis]